MVEFGGGGGGGASFPIVFFDGETETDIGDVTVFPSLDFKRFQTMLSQKIGILPHQFSVHLSSPESRRKIPITGKVNFAAISREKGCFFVVVLRRSRRERRRRNGGHARGGRIFSAGDGGFDPPENVMILKRSVAPGLPGLAWEDARLAGLVMERERYLMSMGLIGLGLDGPKIGTAGKEGRGGGGDAAVVCEDCARARESGREVGFHWCVYDAVTFGFRSMAGPIARPSKGSD